MSLLRDQAINFLTTLTEFFGKPKVSNISNKKLLTEAELALYFGRSLNWTSYLRKKGVFMEKKHYFYLNGLILYSREQIENDIISNSLTLNK